MVTNRPLQTHISNSTQFQIFKAISLKIASNNIISINKYLEKKIKFHQVRQLNTCTVHI